MTTDDFLTAARLLLPADIFREIEHYTPWWDDESPVGFSEPFTEGVVLTLVGTDVLAWRSRHRQLFPVYDGDGEATFSALEQAWALLDGASSRLVEIDLSDPSIHGGRPGIVVATVGASAEIPDPTARAVSEVLAPVGFALLELEAVWDSSSINQGSAETPIGYLWVGYDADR